MKTITKNSGIKLNTGVKAGGIINLNHSRKGISVKSGLKAGGIINLNHNRKGISVKSGLKAGQGILADNHSRVALHG